MIGNFFILGIAVSIIIYVKKVFWSDLANKPFYLWSAIGLCFFLVFSIILPNIELIRSPFTPEISGKVIDGDTNKAISNATVILDWGYESSSFPYHNYGVSTKQKVLITDSNGEFHADRRLKYLAINMSILYKRDNGGVGAIVIKDTYKHADYSFEGHKDQIIRLTKIATAQDKRTERNNLVTIKEMAKRRYIKSVADHVEQLLTNISRHLYIEGVQ